MWDVHFDQLAAGLVFGVNMHAKQHVQGSVIFQVDNVNNITGKWGNFSFLLSKVYFELSQNSEP